MHESERARGPVGATPEPIAGVLAYFTFVPALIFLLVDPYKKNRFVRFHSFQSIAVFVAVVVVAVATRVAAVVLGHIPVLGPLLIVLLFVILALGFFILWLLMLVKALQGEMFKLPLIGHYAERRASR